MLSYEFRLYPNAGQRALLEFSLEQCRQMYNHLLKTLNQQHENGKTSMLWLMREVAAVKKERPGFVRVYSKALQPECNRLFANLRALKQLKKLGKKVGKLRFKSKDRFKTFSYNQSGFKLEMLKPKKGLLRLSKIGVIKVKAHRLVEGKIKQVTLKNRLGKWFAILITDTRIAGTHGDKVLGIDLGINNYLVDSDGNKTPHPHNIDRHAKELASAQRDLARKKRGSKNRWKARLRVAKIHEKVLRCRNDFLHKLSNRYVKGCRVIVVEDLNVKGLIGVSRNAKNIMDASWARFLQMLVYKAGSAGCELAKVNPKNTTKTCSKCGSVKEMPLWQRTFKCDACGVVMDRDHNSAINILNRYLGRESTLARESPSTKAIWHGGSVKQETVQLERLAVSRDASP